MCRYIGLRFAMVLALAWMALPSLLWAEGKTPKPRSFAEHIDKVPPISLNEPFLELLGQADQPLAYTYREAVKLTGHSCGAVAGAWTITRKALEALYPGSIPVRGQIKVTMPGAEDEWYVGVFGEVITFLTGAAPKTGFPGAEFGHAYNRRNLMAYTENPAGTPPPRMIWIFERTDTKAKVGVRYDLNKIRPPITPERTEMGTKVAKGLATPEETSEWQDYWNERARFVFENADTLPGFFVVEKLSY
ncbi:MAG: hypothetical protein C4576_33065 [Desulfobacteraceae bacterium]|jgi:hypothetical protein|nr:MAG: hypothetical protein C4576_33065 [Desulfobacteraceae bacterium]